MKEMKTPAGPAAFRAVPDPNRSPDPIESPNDRKINPKRVRSLWYVDSDGASVEIDRDSPSKGVVRRESFRPLIRGSVEMVYASGQFNGEKP
jgi:hypothetical protein